MSYYTLRVVLTLIIGGPTVFKIGLWTLCHCTLLLSKWISYIDYLYKLALVERWGGWNRFALPSAPGLRVSSPCQITGALNCQGAVLLSVEVWYFSRLELNYPLRYGTSQG